MANIGELSVGVKIDRASVSKMTRDIQTEATKASVSVEGIGTAADDSGASLSKMGEEGAKAGKKIDDGAKKWKKSLTDMQKLSWELWQAIWWFFAVQQITNYVSGAVNASMDFNDAITRVSTVSNASAEELGLLKEQIRDLSIQTGLAAQSLADTAFFIASAGVSIKEIPELLKQVSIFAVAAGTDTTTAFSGMFSVIQAYGLELSTLTQISDLFFRANAQGQLTVEGLAGAIGKVAPLAATAGISVKELFATYSSLVGITGNVDEVTTQISGAIQALAAPTVEASKAFKALGVEVGQSAIAEKGFAGVLKEVYDATGGNLEVLRTLVPEIEGLRAVVALGGNQFETYKTNLEGLNSAAGDTEKALLKYTNTEGFRIKRSQKVWDDWKLSVGQAITSALAAVVTFGDWVVRVMKIVDFGLQTSFQAIFTGASYLVEGLANVFRNFGKFFEVLGSNVSVIGSNIAFNLSQAFNDIPGAISSALGKAIRSIEDFFNETIDGYNALADAFGATSLKIDARVKLGSDSLLAGSKAFGASIRSITDGTEALPNLLEGTYEFSKKQTGELKKMTEEFDAMGLGASLNEKATQDLLKKTTEGITSTIEQQKKSQAQLDAEKKKRDELMKLIEDSRKRGSSGAAATKKENEAIAYAVGKLKEQYSALNDLKRRADDADQKYAKANLDRLAETKKALNEISDKIKSNEAEYEASVAKIAEDTKKRTEETTADYVRQQAERQVALEKTLADLEAQYARDKRDAANAGELFDSKKIEEFDAARKKLQQEIADVKANLAALSGAEAWNVEALLKAERERAALSTDARARKDYEDRIAAIKAQADEERKAAKEKLDADNAMLERQRAIYEFFRSRQQLTPSQLAEIQASEQFRTATGEEQNLILKLGNEMVALTQQKFLKLGLEKELAGEVQKLSDFTTQHAIANVAKLKKEYQDLIMEINAAIAAQNQLSSLAAGGQRGFASGGYTGDGAANAVAGVVHKGEYVLSQDMLSKLPWIVPALESVRAGNVDQSRKVEISGPINVSEALDFESLLRKALYRM